MASSGVPQGGHLSPLLFSLFVNGVSRTLLNCKLLCFADDMKLFMKINTLNDCIKLQQDLDRFTAWFEALGLSLNISKCKVMSFSRSKSPIMHSYFVNDSIINRVYDTVLDLGFKFNSSLDPRPHIDMICCKAFKVLGFIMRLASDFKLKLVVKALFCALVRPILEYGSIIWSPHTAADSYLIERVQRRFLRFAGFLLNIPHPPHEYLPVAEHLNLKTLVDRRNDLGTKFLKNLLDGNVDSPSILSLINFKVPQRQSRHHAPFFIPLCSTNYQSNEPLTRLLKNANEDPSFELC